jgi:hypothetical protein
MHRIVLGCLGFSLLVALGGCATTPTEPGHDQRGGAGPIAPKAISGSADSGGVIGR